MDGWIDGPPSRQPALKKSLKSGKVLDKTDRPEKIV